MTTSEMSANRTSTLSGETTARYWSGPVKAAYATIPILAVVLFVAMGWGPVTLVLVLIDLGVVLWLTTPFGDSKPAGERLAHRLRQHGLPLVGGGRLARGEHIFYNVQHPDAGDPELDPGWRTPPPIGRCGPIDLAGTGLEDMHILRTSNPGEPTFYSVLLSVQGAGSLVRSAWEMDQTAQRFGTLLNEMAKLTSYIRGAQSLHRSVPADITAHTEWYKGQLSAARIRDGKRDDRRDVLVASYGGVIDEMEPLLEEHRDYLVLKFYATGKFNRQAAKIAKAKGAEFDGGVAQLIRNETERMMNFMSGPGGMGHVALLGPRRTAAVIRAMMDPNYALDRDGDVDWYTAFASYIGGEEFVEILSYADEGTGLQQRSDRWYTKVAEVPAGGGIAPAPLGPEWLVPVLTQVDPDRGDDTVEPMPTIRTISVRYDFIPADRAREQARVDQGQDRARKYSEAKKGRVTDGTSDVMSSASERRQQDLMPGSPYHGMTYSMWLSVTGRDPEDLDRAMSRVIESASISAITRLEWQTDTHDVAQFNCLPFGTGLQVPKQVTAGL